MAVIETIKVSEAAILRGVKRDTIYKAIRREEIREVDCGGIKRLIKEDVLNWNPPKGRPKKETKEA